MANSSQNGAQTTAQQLPQKGKVTSHQRIGLTMYSRKPPMTSSVRKLPISITKRFGSRLTVNVSIFLSPIDLMGQNAQIWWQKATIIVVFITHFYEDVKCYGIKQLRLNILMIVGKNLLLYMLQCLQSQIQKGNRKQVSPNKGQVQVVEQMEANIGKIRVSWKLPPLLLALAFLIAIIPFRYYLVALPLNLFAMWAVMNLVRVYSTWKDYQPLDVGVGIMRTKYGWKPWFPAKVRYFFYVVTLIGYLVQLAMGRL